MITLRDIVELTPLRFTLGDSGILKKLMLKNESEFLRFKGKDQFDKKVKAIYPDINIYDLYEDYITNRRICSAIHRFCLNYYEHGEKLVYRFHFEEGIDEKTGERIGHEFKKLDGITRPTLDEFWNTFLPPNYIGDYCSVHFAYKEDITPIPLNLPHVDSRFIYDLKHTYLSKITPSKPAKKETKSVDMDVTGFAIPAFKDALYEVYGIPFTEDEIKRMLDGDSKISEAIISDKMHQNPLLMRKLLE